MRRNAALRDLAEHLGVPTVVTGDVHCHHPRRTDLQDVLVAIRCRTSLDGCERERRGNRESVLVTAQEMRECFPDDRAAVERSGELAARLEFDVTQELGYRYPDFSEGAEPAIRQLGGVCEAAFDERYRSPCGSEPQGLRRRARERLTEELALVDELGLAGFFLLHWEVRAYGEPIDLSRIPLDDRAVFAEIQAADTVGDFQIESRAQMQSLLRTKPATIDDLTVQVALVRPGPIQGKAVHPYIDARERLRVDPAYEPPVDHPPLDGARLEGGADTARPAARPDERDARPDRLGADARRLPADESLRRRPPARPAAPAPARRRAREPRAERGPTRLDGALRGHGDRPAAARNRERDRLHAARGRARPGEPIVPPAVYERHRGIVRGEPLLLVRGRFERIGQNRNVLVSEIETLGPLARSAAAGGDVGAALPSARHFGHR